MRRYETFVIIDPDLAEDQRVPLIGRVEDLITQMDGFLVAIDDWGERKLAYDIKKKGRGYYVRFDYCGLAPLVDEIERFFRIDDRALKYMTVLLNADADLDKIKEEKAAAEAIAAQESSEAANAPEEDQQKELAPEKDQEKELAPAEEQTKTDEEVPTSKTEDPVAEKTPSSIIEEA
jgi:small subunit ribosomal protein S6